MARAGRENVRTRSGEDRPGRAGADLKDFTARGARLSALAHAAQQGSAAIAQRRRLAQVFPTPPVAQRQLSYVELGKIGKDGDIYKAMVGATVYSQILGILDTAQQVHEVFGDLKGDYPALWAQASMPGFQLGKQLAKKLSTEKAGIGADAVGRASAKVGGGTPLATPSTPLPTLAPVMTPTPFQPGLVKPSALGSSNEAKSWGDVKLLLQGKKPTGITDIKATGAEWQSKETAEMGFSARMPEGVILIVLHYHPGEDANDLHFKESREGKDNVPVDWGHWLIVEAGVKKGDFAKKDKK